MSDKSDDIVGMAGLTGLTEYERGWARVIEELRGCPAIEVFEVERDPVKLIEDDPDEVFADLEDDYGLTLDPAFRRGYLRFSEISSAWQTTGDLPFISGEFHIEHVEEIFSGNAPDWLGSSATDGQELDFTEFRVIDGTPEWGLGANALLRVQPGVGNPEVWFDEGLRGTWKLDLDFRGYLDALQLTKGTFGWQYLFADGVVLRGDDFEGKARNLKNMLDVFPELFPDYDYAPLRKRLARRLGKR